MATGPSSAARAQYISPAVRITRTSGASLRRPLRSPRRRLSGLEGATAEVHGLAQVRGLRLGGEAACTHVGGVALERLADQRARLHVPVRVTRGEIEREAEEVVPHL